MKDLIVFDLDGTLAESKSSLDGEMAALLGTLLGVVKVAVISGGNWPQFEKQLLSNLPRDGRLKNLSLLPTCGTKFYQYESWWEPLYSEGGNDYPAKEAGVVSIQVRDPDETKRVIEAILACWDCGQPANLREVSR
jgi:hydroxymethylpyrimidine pyrophosphatase-like HAD family hydrolase